ncbi:MAG: O-antigen ligase family protein, partial [Bacilli bacterium]|nr:O-antigen ligase family protein [Bacilli bacterium]
KEKDKNIKLILGIILLLGYINVILTFTRSTILIIFGTIFLLCIFFRKKILNKYTISMGLICIIVGMLIPGSNILMLSSLNDASKLVLKEGIFDKYLPDEGNPDKDAEMGDYSLAHRKLFAKTGIAIGKDHMLTGIGFGSYIDYLKTDEFKIKYPKYKEVFTHPHSSYILMFSEVGILAVIAFTTFLGTLIRMMISGIKNNKDVSFLILVVTIGFYIVNIMAENLFYDTQVFPIYLLITGLSLGYIKNNKLIKE